MLSPSQMSVVVWSILKSSIMQPPTTRNRIMSRMTFQFQPHLVTSPTRGNMIKRGNVSQPLMPVASQALATGRDMPWYAVICRNWACLKKGHPNPNPRLVSSCSLRTWPTCKHMINPWSETATGPLVSAALGCPAIDQTSLEVLLCGWAARGLPNLFDDRRWWNFLEAILPGSGLPDLPTGQVHWWG